MFGWSLVNKETEDLKSFKTIPLMTPNHNRCLIQSNYYGIIIFCPIINTLKNAGLFQTMFG